MKDKKTILKAVLLAVLFIAVIGGITLVLLPYIRKLSEPEYQAAIQNWIDNMGFAGVLILLGAQMLQVIIAFIPGEPFELLSGALYGSVGGLAICLIGCIAASSLIFILSRKAGKKLLYRIFGKEKIQGWKWLQSSQKVDLVIFVLFFIPGTPKDLLTYIVGITNITLGKFLTLSTIARIPSVISSTMIGASVRQGNASTALIVFIITGVVGIGGILFKDKIINHFKKNA